MIVHVLRKPLTGTVAANALQHGCGALNIDECRVGFSAGRWPANLVHDGDANAVFPEAGNGWKKNYGAEIYAIENRQYGGGSFGGGGFGDNTYADSGSAARFFQQVTIK